MKNLLCALLTLAVLLGGFALAESLFPSLSTPEAVAVTGGKAPSYGGMANVDPDDVQPYAEGGQVVTYENVDEQGYQDFGVYLNELGYEVVAQNVQGRTAEMKISDGKYNIGMVYYGEEQKMVLIYEEGVEFERKDYFKDYTELLPGKDVELSFGTLSFTEFHTGEPFQLKSRPKYDSLGKKQSRVMKECSEWVEFMLTNDTPNNVRLNELVHTSLIWINKKGDVFDYTNEFVYGKYNNESWPISLFMTVPAIDGHSVDVRYYSDATDIYGYTPEEYLDFQIKSLSTMQVCTPIMEEIPDQVLQTKEGILAITVDCDGQHFVIYLRK